MPHVNAQKMIELLQENESLRLKIDREATNKEVALQLVVNLGQDNGLDFTAEELIDELKALGINLNDNGGIEPLSETLDESGELSDEALDAVAGGMDNPYYEKGDCSQW